MAFRGHAGHVYAWGARNRGARTLQERHRARSRHRESEYSEIVLPRSRFKWRPVLRRTGGSSSRRQIEWNRRFYFPEFAAAAQLRGLEYLRGGEPHEMFM